MQRSTASRTITGIGGDEGEVEKPRSGVRAGQDYNCAVMWYLRTLLYRTLCSVLNVIPSVVLTATLFYSHALHYDWWEDFSFG